MIWELLRKDYGSVSDDGVDTFGNIQISYNTTNGSLFNVTKKVYVDESGNNSCLIMLLHPINGTKYSGNITLNKTINGFEGEFSNSSNGAHSYIMMETHLLGL